MLYSDQLWKQHTSNFSLLEYLLIFLLPCLLAKPTKRRDSLHSSLDNLMESLATAAAVSALVEPHRSLAWGFLWNSHVVIYGLAACVVLPGVQVFAVVWIYVCSEITQRRESRCLLLPARHCSPPGTAGAIPWATQPACDNVSVIRTQV